jgi:hypothetical protein
MPKKPESKSNPSRKAGADKEIVLRSAAPVIQVLHLDEPPTFVKPKKIHRRHLLPLIREGDERGFHSQTTAAMLRPAAMAGPMDLAMAATDEVVLAKNTELTAPGKKRTASNVGEPSVAVNGNVVFYTGNWYAAVSADGGTSFKFIDPATQFPDPAPNSSFCCDQVVQYIKKLDMFVWLLQYGPDSGDNIQRLAFAKTSDLVAGKWKLFDITTQNLNVAGAFLDFPDLAVGANCLYVTTNIFGPGDQVGSGVVRIPFAGIQAGAPKARPFVSMNLQSFRVAQNCGTTAFFAAHQNTSTLSVFSWDEAQNQPVNKLVPVARWLGGNGYFSRTPDGRRWLDRADPRITGATLAKNELWFAWAVDTNSNHRPKPFVQIARIKATDLTLLDNINIFDPDSAVCYGALSTNANDEVGISYMIGGGTREPSHAVGILTGTRKDVVVSTGDRAPFDPQTGKGEWGDYLTVRRVFPNEKLFAATGYTMKGPEDGSNRDCTPRFVIFGRSSDVSQPSIGGGATDTTGSADVTGGATGVSPATATAAVADINSLPVVSAAVATSIKAACMAEGKKAMPEDVLAALRLVTKPGVERWPVKTGTDQDVNLVGKNIVNGHKLGAGIVPATLEELIRIPRPFDMSPPTQDFHQFQERRRGPVEFVIWRIEVDIIALKQEADGDYHLVLQGASGKTMIAEAPTPFPPFVAASSPWTKNLAAVRKAIDDKIVNKLSPHNFVQLDDTLVPRESLSASGEQQQPMAMPAGLPESFSTPRENETTPMPTFQTKVKPTACRLTGVGFFDRVHDQTGVSLLNGIELHPILKIEFM